jgi:glycosyltransferase involved in cell wall biosynthesis
VTQGYRPGRGGTELVIQRISEELVERHGAQVTVFTTNCYNGEAFYDPSLPRMPVGWDTYRGVQVRRFAVRSDLGWWCRRLQAPAWRLRLPGNQYLRALASGPIISGLGREIDATPADVIAASSFPLMHMFAAVRAARRRNLVPVLIGGLHPDDRWGFDRPMIYRAIRESLYVAYSQYEADVVIARGAHPARVFVVGAGVDPEPFVRADRRAACERLGLDPNLPVVGYIGQLGGHKGIDTLVLAMRHVWRRHPDAQLLIAGARSLFVPVIEAMLEDLPPSQRGRVRLVYDFADEQKPELFAAVDVFAYPSGYESFGIAFVEAWAAGKPVVGCRRGAVPSVVSDGIDGVLTTWRDAADLADAIIGLLSRPDVAREMGTAGHAKMLRRYTWPHVADRIADVYRLAITVGRATG